MLTVLGGGGFLGTALARRLIEDRNQVRVVDDHIPDMPFRREVWDSATEHLVCDLRDPDSAARACLQSEWVFHLAADVGGVGYLSTHDYDPFFNNMQMSMNVLRACERLGVERLFFASSSCAYPVEHQDGSNYEPLREDVHLETGQPDLMYGREKLMTLRLCERAPFDARVGLVNTAFGPGLKLDGERMKYPAAITTRAIRAISEKTPLDIWGSGTQVRGYIHGDDAVEKMVRIMTDPYQGPVNITSKDVASCRDIALMVLDILGHPDVPLRYVNGPEGVSYRLVSNEKWERVYGSDTQRSIRQAFEDFVAWVEASL